MTTTLKWLLIILALVIIGSGGWFYYENYYKKPIPTPTVITPTKKVEKPKVEEEKKVEDETADWKTYTNEKYGFSVKYPKEWGDTTSKENVFNAKDIRDEDKVYYEGIDLSKIATKSTNISFDGKFCTTRGKGECEAGFVIHEYSASTPLELECYEGVCRTTNIIEEKQKIDHNSNILIGGLKGMMQDGYFVPGGNFQRFYTVITPQYKLSIEAGYEAKGFIFDKSCWTKEVCTPPSLFLEEVIKSNPESPVRTDFETFLQNLNQVVSTFKFTK